MIFISLSLLFLPLALFLIPYCTKMSCESYKWMTNRTRDKRICRLIILLGNGQNHMPLYSKLYRWLDSRSYSYSPYWTGASLQLRLTREVFSNTNDFYLFIIIFPRMSLHCKLVPVQYREYEYGLFNSPFPSWPKSLYQSEACCSTIINLHVNDMHLHMKGRAPRIALRKK